MLLLLLNSVSVAQEPILFRHFTRRDNLATNQVFEVLKDKKGFTWFATGNGLQRFDGKRWLSFKKNSDDPSSLPDNRVKQLLEDSNDRLWIATASGVAIFDRNNFKCHPVGASFKSRNNTYDIISFKQTGDGKIWICLRPGGLFVFNEQKKTFEPYTVLLPPFNNSINEICFDKLNNRYWLGTDSGMIVYDLNKKKYYHKDHNPYRFNILDTRLGFQQTVAASINSRNELWCSAWRHHYAVDLLTNKIIFRDTNRVSGIRFYLTDRKGNVWGSGMNFVKADLDAQKFELIKNEQGTLNNPEFVQSTALFEDDEENIWLPSDNGVYMFNLSRQLISHHEIRTYYPNQLKGFNTTGFIELNDGSIVLITWGHHGLYFFNDKLRQTATPISIDGHDTDTTQLLAWCGLQDSRGEVWVGAQTGELLKINVSKKKVESIFNPAFQEKTILSIAEDKFGNLWFGGRRQNIVKWERSVNRFVVVQGSQSPDEGDGSIRKLLYDGDRFIYASIAGIGLVKINVLTNTLERKFTYNPHSPKPFPVVSPLDMIWLSSKEIAVGTDKGLLLMDIEKENFRLLTTTDGLPHNEVISLVKDNNGLIWLATPNGISYYNPASKKTYSLNINDGLQDEIFSSAATLKLSNGRILFGSAKGFASLDPDGIRSSDIPPAVTITGIRLFDENLNTDSILAKKNQLSLKYNQNHLTIQFSVMSLLLNDKLDYYYQLDGIDKDWRKADNDQQATYSYLPGGVYNFKIKAVSKEGVESKSITSFKVIVKRPFWNQWWFYLLCTALISVGIYLYSSNKIERKQAAERVRSRIARDLHDDMGSTLSTINILSEMAKQKVEKDINKAKELIHQISDNSVSMMESMDDIVWSIDPAHDNMEEIVSRMRSFAGDLMEAKGIEYNFKIDETIEELNFDLEKRHDLMMIFKEAVNNLIKYSQCSHAAISMELKNQRLILRIKDDGKGFDISIPSEGNGIMNMEKRAAALKATVKVFSGKSEGTLVELNMPV